MNESHGGDAFSCVETTESNPRDFFKRVTEQTGDFEIERLQLRSDANNYEDDEFIIKNLVPYAAKHCFIEEELGSDEDEKEPCGGTSQVIDSGSHEEVLSKYGA